jgi:hypothetical protein
MLRRQQTGKIDVEYRIEMGSKQARPSAPPHAPKDQLQSQFGRADGPCDKDGMAGTSATAKYGVSSADFAQHS